MVSRYAALLAADLDGTLLDDPVALAGLNGEPAHLHGPAALVYVTRRSLIATLMLIETKNLPQPTFIVADAGTHIYDGPEWLLDIRWHQRMSHRWSPSRVRAVAGFFPMLVRQPPECQAAFKCSYYLDEAISAATLSTLQDALHVHRVAARMVYSGGRHLDLLPLGGGKDAAVRFLAERLQLPMDRVVTSNVPHDGLL